MAVQDSAQQVETKGFFGHPGGLSTLFFTEMWERFSYYGMRALLVLYMTAAISGTVVDGVVVTNGGMGLTTKTATAIYGFYTAAVYFLPLIGGWIADRFTGAKKATFIGGVIIMLGHFSLAIPTDVFFFVGLAMVAIGTGLLKSNISAMVGDLYKEGDDRRDAGFSIFYMGINLGAFLAPFVCGTLAIFNYHWGFAAAGVGMLLGLIQYVVGRKKLEGVGEAPVKSEVDTTEITPAYLIQLGVLLVVCIAVILGYMFAFASGATLAESAKETLTYVMPPVMIIGGLIGVLLTGMQDKLNTDEWKRIGIIVLLFLFAALFWMGFEQAGSSFNLFAEQLTDRELPAFLSSGVTSIAQSIAGIFGYTDIKEITEFPAEYFQSVNALMIVMLAPIFSILWIKWGKSQPNDVMKFSLGLFFLALGFVVMAYASGLTGAGAVSPLWLVLVYFLHTCGELFLSPVGLSSMTKLAPGKMVGLMLGVWFLASSLGSFAAGLVAGEFEAKQDTLVGLFWNVAIVTFVGAALALLLSFAVGGFLKSRQKTDEVPVEPA
jgi:POT family proton-dependent oligopeptide transporter